MDRSTQAFEGRLRSKAKEGAQTELDGLTLCSNTRDPKRLGHEVVVDFDGYARGTYLKGTSTRSGRRAEAASLRVLP